MIEKIYQILLYPFALISYYFVTDTNEEFESVKEMKEYHFQYEYSFDDVAICYIGIPHLLIIYGIVKLASYIGGVISQNE